MTKYLQNKIAGSRITLPVACLYSFVVWLASGVIQEQWWLQLFCFAFTAYLMAILNSKNSLIRIYSRLISVFFMVFTCCNCLLFPSIREAVSILFLVLCYFILFSSYQDKTATGLTLYGFAALGAATMSNVHLLYYVPLFWLFMRYNLLSLSWRTWMASVLGLLLPYWFVADRGRLNKGKIHCSCGMCATKTRNKGKRRHLYGNYAPNINYKINDLRQIQQMNWDEFHWYEENIL